MFARLKLGAAPENGRGRRVYLQVVENNRHRPNGWPSERVSQRVIATLGRVEQLSVEAQGRLRMELTALLANVQSCKTRGKG